MGPSAPWRDLMAVAWLVLTGAGSLPSDRSQPGLSRRLQLSHLPSHGGSREQNAADLYLDVRVCPFLDWGARGAPCSAWCWGGPAGPWLWVQPEGVGSGRCLALSCNASLALHPGLGPSGRPRAGGPERVLGVLVPSWGEARAHQRALGMFALCLKYCCK